MEKQTEAINILIKDFKNRESQTQQALRYYIMDRNIDLDTRWKTFYNTNIGTKHHAPLNFDSLFDFRTIDGISNIFLNTCIQRLRGNLLGAYVPMRHICDMAERLIGTVFEGSLLASGRNATITRTVINNLKEECMNRLTLGYYRLPAAT